MGLRTKLSALFFLQFAVWGCYLVSLGQFLGGIGLGRYIPWFYAVGGFAALFMPTVVGVLVDRYVQGQKMLSLCHFAGAVWMTAFFVYSTMTEVAPMVSLVLFSLSVFAYIPTVALCNTIALRLLRERNISPSEAFPRIRMWGTVGFVVAMWVVNSVWVVPGDGVGITFSDTDPHAMQRMQYTSMQLAASAVTEFVLAFFALTLPRVACCKEGAQFKETILMPLKLFSDRRLASLFIFSMFIGVALQINNGYVAPYLTHFRGMPEFASSFGANNATLLSSLSQISEALWMLPVGAVLARLGVKTTIFTAIVAWVVNFACFALGDTGSGLWLIVTAMIVYGVAFDFFNVAGAIYIDRVAPHGAKAAAQGVQMMMTKGVGSSLGMLGAGAVVNHFCSWTMDGTTRYLMGDWSAVWTIFAAYCALVALSFIMGYHGVAASCRPSK